MIYAQLTRKTHETHGAAWCAAEARKLNDSYFPGVSAHIPLCALASFALAPPPAFEFNRAATARRVHRAAQIAPRNFRRAIRAAQAAPTHRNTSAYPPAL